MKATTPVPKPAASLASSGDTQSEMARVHALVERLGATGRRTTSELLEELRRAFPNSPLAVRVRALEALRQF